MSEKLVALVHFADPDFFPHTRRIATLLSSNRYRVWAIGITHKDQKKSKHPLVCYRKTVFGERKVLPSGIIRLLMFTFGSFIVLWKEKPDVLLPIDVLALFPCWLHSVLRNIPFHYFTLEDMGAHPHLIKKPVQQRFWMMLENFCIKRAQSVAVTAEIDALSHVKRCKIEKPFVIRNVPELYAFPKDDELWLRHRFGWTQKHFVFHYAGLIAEGRGIELMFPLLKEMPNARFSIAGMGNLEKDIKDRAIRAGVWDQIGWVGSYIHSDLRYFAPDADAGVIIPENISAGHFQVLPCKLFEYVHAGLPVIGSNFPEIERYVGDTGVGVCVDPSRPEQILAAAKRMMEDSAFYGECKKACLSEREKTNWQTESRVCLDFLNHNKNQAQS